MSLNDRTTDRQPDPQTLGFGRIKCIKEAINILGVKIQARNLAR